MLEPGKTLSVLLAVGAVLSVLPGHVQAQNQARTPLALKSVSIDLPMSDRTFPGPGADAINNNCLACHSAGMILYQPAMPRAVWEAEVHKMITVYKAPVAVGDVPAIVSYLASTKGTKQAEAPPSR